MIKYSNSVIFLALLGLAAPAIAQRPTQIALEPLSGAQAALLAENEQLRKQIQELKQRIDTAEGLLHATFVAQNQRGQLAAFRTSKPAHYELTSLVPSKDRPIFLPLLKKNQLSIVPDNSDIVAASRDQPLGSEIADQQLVTRLDNIWKSQRFIDVPPKGSLKGIFVHKSRENIDDFGVLVGNRKDSVTYVNWDGFTKSIPVDAPSFQSAYTGDLQEFVRENACIDFVSYAALMVAHKIGHQDGQRGAINLAISVDAKSMSESESINQEFQTAITALGLLLGSLNSSGPPKAFNKGLELENIASRMTDELYTRFVRLGVPVVERETLDKIFRERSFQQQSAFESYEYAGLLNATHIAHFEVSIPTSFGPYHVEVKLLDCNSGRVIWSDGRDRIDLSQRPNFARSPLLARVAPQKAVHLSFDRSAIEKMHRPKSAIERGKLYRDFKSRRVWLLGSNDDQIRFCELFSIAENSVPKQLLNLRFCKHAELDFQDQRRHYDYLGFARKLMLTVGKVTALSKNTDEIAVEFPAGVVPKIGTELFPMVSGSPSAFSIATIGTSRLQVSRLAKGSVIAVPAKDKFAALAGDPTKAPAMGDLVCFGNSRLIESKLVPLSQVGVESGQPQTNVETDIMRQLEQFAGVRSLVFPALGRFGTRQLPRRSLRGRNASQSNRTMTEMELLMFMDDSDAGLNTRGGEWVDEIPNHLITNLRHLRGGAQLSLSRKLLVPILHQDKSKDIKVLFVVYDSRFGKVEPALGQHRLISIPDNL